jgi:predicted secreted Zn-dependent protease
MLARYYSSSLSRFLSADPGDDTDMGIPQTWNAYSYVRNNPLKFLDTTGEATTLHSSTQTYEVTGNTAAEAWSNAAAQNPDGFAGHTSWSIAITKIDTMEAGSQELGTAVSMATDVDVSVTTTTTLPSWNAPAGAPAGEQQKFDSEKAGLAQHEQGHVQIAEKGGRSLEQTVKNSVGTGQGATTGQAKANAKGDLKQKAEKSRQDQVKKTDKKQKDYDKKTGHGRRQ